jgi:hypothetical protein
MSGFSSGFVSYVFQDYQEGTYTPTFSASWNLGTSTVTGRWVKNGKVVTVMINLTGGTTGTNAGGATISTPSELTPAKMGAGIGINSNGTMLGGSGLFLATTAGQILCSQTISTTTTDKVIIVSYEV